MGEIHTKGGDMSVKRLSVTQQLDRALLLLFRYASEDEGVPAGKAIGEVVNLLGEPTRRATIGEATAVKMLRLAIECPALDGGYDADEGDGETHESTVGFVTPSDGEDKIARRRGAN